MKKVTFMIGALTFAMVAFVSCNKNKTENGVSFQGSTTEFKVEEEGEKAYIDINSHIYFEKGDLVKLFNINNETPGDSKCADYSAASTGANVQFNAVEQMPAECMSSFYGFFPAGNVTPDLANENRATFALNPVQTYYEVNGVPSFSKEDMYMASNVSGISNINDAHFAFQNICGILRLKYYDTGGWTIRNIKVVDKHFNLTGNVNLKVDKVTTDGLVSLCESYNPADPSTTAQAISDYKDQIGYNVTDAGNTVTLDFGTEGHRLSASASDPDVFYIVLRPLALAHGYKVIVTDMNDKEWTVVDSNTNKKMVPNTIKGNAAKDLKSYH